MRPLVVVGEKDKKFEEFIRNYCRDNAVSPVNVFSYFPEKKEFSIDQIKEIKEGLAYAATKPCLYLLYEFDTASREAQNALLKTLEEHQPHVGFIIQVVSQYALLSTILSRCKMVILNKKQPKEDKDLKELFGDFLHKGNLSIMDSKAAEGTDPLTYQRFLGNLLLFFRKRLADDRMAGQIIREVIDVSRLVTRNNLNPQHAIDHLLIFIKKKYTQ